MAAVRKLLLRSLMTGVLFIAMGCTPGDTVTLDIELETDTFISNQSSEDHSELNYLSILRDGNTENRALVKLPTGDKDQDGLLDECLDNIYCFTFFLPLAVLAKLISPSCEDESFTAANLNWAHLEFATVDGSSPAVGILSLSLVAQPWWHTVNWTTTHPFSKQGIWATPGGSIDSSVNFETNCNNLQGGQSCAAGEVKFEMTDYFKGLLNNPNSTHFGLMIQATADTPEIRLHSVQTSEFFSAPSLVANYNCITTSKAETNRYYLNQPLD